MDQAITRAAGATPSTTPPAAAAPRLVGEFQGFVDGIEPSVHWLDRKNMPQVGDRLFAIPAHAAVPRSWSILLTSANHGTVGPLGSTFPHAGEHHERVIVVEVPASAGAPSDQVNLVLRASRQVANKAEIEPVAWMTPSDWKKEPLATADVSVANAWRRDNREVTPLFATPPATTGASTARDQALEDAAAVCDKKYEARAASGHPREASAARSCASEIRALKGSVGASTVLTDERIDRAALEKAIEDRISAREDKMMVCPPPDVNKRLIASRNALTATLDRLFAAQAGQVAPTDLQVRRATDELSLPELAEQFAAVEALGCDYTLSAKVCGKLFRAMTTPPDDVAGQVAVPGWISVDARLPDAGYCLATYRNQHGKLRIIRAKYARQFEIDAGEDAIDQGNCEYNEADDTFYLKAGWLECIDNWDDYSSIYVTEGEVTHWMPLPAAPSPAKESK